MASIILGVAATSTPYGRTNVATKRFAWILTLLLALSVTGNLVHTYVERARGVGLEIAAMGASPLATRSLLRSLATGIREYSKTP